MKCAIILRGNHGIINTNGRKWGPIDWRKCYNSLKENYIDIRTQEGYNIDIFYQTYESEENNQLKEIYKPIDSLVYKFTSDCTQIKSMIDSISLLKNIYAEYDEILFTRFDILWKCKITECNIINNHFMIPWQHPKKNYCDVMFVFPGRMIPIFLNSIKKHGSNNNIHGMIFPRPHKVMFNKKYYSDSDYPEYFPLNNNPLYILYRERRWGFKNKEEAYKAAKEQGWIK
jgi:hypothetical protein